MSQRNLTIVVLLGLFVGFTAIYWASSSPVPSGYADSDELLTTSLLFSVAHPPGFALFTTLTTVLLRMFSQLNPALVGNYWAGILQASALAILFRLSLSLWPKMKLQDQTLPTVASTTAIVILGCSWLWWLYATIFEVMAFTNVVVAGLLLAAWSWYNQTQNKFHWGWYLTTWALAGVCLGHNPLTLLLGPGLLLLLIAGSKRIKEKKHSYLWVMAGVLTLGLALIISNLSLWGQMGTKSDVSWYVNPTVNGWTNHLLRTDFSGFSYDRGVSFNAYNLSPTLINYEAMTAFLYYFVTLSRHFGWWVVLLGFFGFVLTYKNHRIAFWVLGLWFLCTGPLLSGYMGASPPTFQPAFFKGVSERQLLISYMIFILLTAWGFLVMGEMIFKKTSSRRWVITVALSLLLVALEIGLNKSILTQKTNRLLVSEYSTEVLNQAEDRAIIICTSDIDCYSLMYANFINSNKRDITVLPHVPTYKVWYLRDHPTLYPFEDMSEPDFLKRLIETSINSRPIYLTNGVGFYPDYIGWEKGPYYLQPEGLLFRLRTQKPQISETTFPQVFTQAATAAVDPRDTFFYGIREVWGNMRAYAAYLALLYGNKDNALAFLNQALQLDPNNEQAQELANNLDKYAQELRLP